MTRRTKPLPKPPSQCLGNFWRCSDDHRWNTGAARHALMTRSRPQASVHVSQDPASQCSQPAIESRTEQPGTPPSHTARPQPPPPPPPPLPKSKGRSLPPPPPPPQKKGCSCNTDLNKEMQNIHRSPQEMPPTSLHSFTENIPGNQPTGNSTAVRLRPMEASPDDSSLKQHLQMMPRDPRQCHSTADLVFLQFWGDGSSRSR